ncbi:hypothetical protein LTR36_001386 [Oleoguttula mirabilis]|uniref:Uncharacterized protein n=1 Tax=Oleoguttula mirabilis TaxID=1507867 RepID=A0AAV9JP48_9PEZI|nr:hypothetical protein LTR36_001386 [Oleoguttula mirabilis]
MSSDRSTTTGRPLKPTLASTRLARTPLTPRVAGNAPSSTRSAVLKTPSTARSEAPTVTPRVKQESGLGKDALTIGNVTPRSSARTSRAGSATPTLPEEDTPSAPRPRSTIGTASVTAERNATVGGPGIGSSVRVQSKARVTRPRSVVSDGGPGRARSPPLVRSPGVIDLSRPAKDESIGSRFFHASDVRKTELAPRKLEPKRAGAFFHADGQQEQPKTLPPRTASPVLSAVSEKRSSGPWIRADGASNPSRSPPMLSPALSSLSSTSPFFAATTGQQKSRSPSPSKDNIHLSYRKGASQIFGTRPSPRASVEIHSYDPAKEGRGSLGPSPSSTPHKKSPSLSSIDSGNSHQSRRRSATTLDATPSPLVQEVKSATMPRVSKPIPSIDTSLDPPDIRPAPEWALSPTKSISELASDARRERKVLDLEISNSSLLAINSSLEREVRRQKTELKRFRRLSRAGRFSYNPNERAARLSEGLSTLGEEDVPDADYSVFGPPSGFTDVYDDFSDDESESVTSSGEPLSPSAQVDRLAKDEKRLRVDLEKHKELLVQSQMMNQSIKRCMFATEEMIKDGKKALQYHVRISDVKMGGRILTGHEDDEEDREGEIEIEDETLRGDDAAEDFLKTWQGVGRPVFEGSEGTDRDSGIEVDKPTHTSTAGQQISGASDSGRPPDE